MRFIAIKCSFKDSCYSKPEPSLSLLICDIQGQKATTYCAFPSSSSAAAATAAAAPVTSLSLHLLWPLFPLHFLIGQLSLFPLSLSHAVRMHTSISPWVTSSAASHLGITHTPDLTFHWHLSVFASVDLCWVKIIEPLMHIEPFWRAVSCPMGPAGAVESRHRSR